MVRKIDLNKLSLEKLKEVREEFLKREKQFYQAKKTDPVIIRAQQKQKSLDNENNKLFRERTQLSIKRTYFRNAGFYEDVGSDPANKISPKFVKVLQDLGFKTSHLTKENLYQMIESIQERYDKTILKPLNDRLKSIEKREEEIDQEIDDVVEEETNREHELVEQIFAEYRELDEEQIITAITDKEEELMVEKANKEKKAEIKKLVKDVKLKNIADSQRRKVLREMEREKFKPTPANIKKIMEAMKPLREKAEQKFVAEQI